MEGKHSMLGMLPINQPACHLDEKEYTPLMKELYKEQLTRTNIYPSKPSYAVGQPSLIHGMGVMSTRDIAKGEKIYFPPFGVEGGFNSSCDQNLSTEREDLDHWMVCTALRDIRAGEELTLGYALRQGWLDECNCHICHPK